AYQYDGIGNRSSATHGGTNTGVTYTPNAINQYSNITTEGGRFILGEAPLTNDVIINGDTNTPAARAGGLGFYWKQITGDNSTGPLWSNDSVASDGVTITGNTWTPRSVFAPVNSHDEDGNLKTDGRWDYSWDAENRITSMQTTIDAAAAGVPRLRLDFVYDSQNRRVSKTVYTSTDGTTWIFSSNLRSLYDGWNIIAEYSAPSETSTTLTLQAAHLWGIDLSGTLQGAGGVGGLLASHLFNPGATCFPAYDGNGNISAWLGASGNLLARMDYSPFGQLVAQYKFTGTGDTTLSRLHFGFSTKHTDAETGMLDYGLRIYNPVTGGWQSKDLIEESGGLNLYGFVGNDGVNKVDKFGLKAYSVYRPFKDGWMRYIYPVVGHVFLAFNNDFTNPDDKAQWDKFIENFSDERDSELITMSFHPLSVKGARYKNDNLPDNAGNIIGIITTSGSYGWIDDPDDKQAYKNAGKWYKRGNKYLLTEDVCTQIKLFKTAYKSMKKNIQGHPDPGIYELLNRNCGTWVKTMAERERLNYPLAATVTYNMGATYGGPIDFTGLPKAITYAAKKISLAAEKGKNAH
ncbi:MAG: RHS repeat-associated core domain-containing protein, partial [Verrucomicrobiota bacterium]